MTAAPSLPELQRRLMAFVLGETASGASEAVRGNGLAAETRLGIYRNMIFSSFTSTLATSYPAVKALVGEAFFESAAARYIRDEPSLSGNLQDYGAAFPAWLARMPEATSLPYLADVARLEWARQVCLLAADTTALDPARLAVVPESSQSTLRLSLHPGLRLVDSAFPILDLWLFCQEPQNTVPSLDSAGQYVMLWRDDGQIAMREIDAGLYALLAAMLEGATLNKARQLAVEHNAAFDLEAALRQLFDDGLICGYDY